MRTGQSLCNFTFVFLQINKNLRVIGAVILLQIVTVSPVTHLVNNHESLYIINASEFKKTRSA